MRWAQSSTLEMDGRLGGDPLLLERAVTRCGGWGRFGCGAVKPGGWRAGAGVFGLACERCKGDAMARVRDRARDSLIIGQENYIRTYAKLRCEL